jgi:RNA polymerase sigma-70 factor, ECF subfamily
MKAPIVNYDLLSDQAIMDLISNRDQNALSVLYDRYARLVYSMAYSAVGRSELAADISQDVFIKIWEKSASFDPSQGKLSTWIASITRYRSIDVLRRLNVRPEGNMVPWEYQDAQNSSDPDESPVEEAVEKSVRRQRIQKALAQLPENQRQVLALAYFQGYTNSEIAELLQEPLGTVKTRIRLGMQKLRLILEGDLV